ncbi:MAG: hypothetical protein ACXWL2_01520 [Candidatus Chromulinivorax sp.]
MWPWQQNVQYNKRYFFQEIVSIVFFVHLIVLILLFIGDTYQFHQERFVIQPSQSHATIVFMPLQKRITQQPVQTTSSTTDRKVITIDQYEQLIARNQEQKNVQSVIKIQPKQDSIQKPITTTKSIAKMVPDKKKSEQKLATATTVKKISAPVSTSSKKSTTIVQPKKEIKKSPIVKKVEPKKVEEKVLEKKPKIEEKIKAVQVEKKVEKSTQTVNQLEDKVVEPEKKELESVKKEAKVEDEKKDIAQPQEHNQLKSSSLVDSIPLQAPVQNVALEVVKQSDILEQEVIDLSNVVFVGSQDLEMMQIKEQIELQLIKFYKPPVGIKKDAVCELSVTIGKSGKAEKVMVKKSSGSIANDLCAKAAALKAIYPKQVCGKEIIIALGQ